MRLVRAALAQSPSSRARNHRPATCNAHSPYSSREPKSAPRWPPSTGTLLPGQWGPREARPDPSPPSQAQQPSSRGGEGQTRTVPFWRAPLSRELTLVARFSGFGGETVRENRMAKTSGEGGHSSADQLPLPVDTRRFSEPKREQVPPKWSNVTAPSISRTRAVIKTPVLRS
ncbi:hypothetical protein FALBO_11018 [Fusarium albosuccineum]|uniref:Uncharacterized protein n=1 Tax=Fusarium albosuccineum TaxID=1237068 RepID=A0A8H4L5X8_9HYPO|nr:hypothetical protein FALBO_11018 [Fusarium albosuccineum]